MTSRIAIAVTALGLLLFAGGLFLSEGYSAKRGLLESLPRMKVRITEDEKRARFSQIGKSETKAGPLIDFEGHLIQMPYQMEDFEVRRVLKAFDAQRIPAKTDHKVFFEGWTVDTQGVTLPLRLVLALASALIIIGIAVLVGARLRGNRRVDG